MKRAAVALLLDTLQLRSDLTPDVAGARWRTVDTRGLLALLQHEGAEVWLYKRLRQLRVELDGVSQHALRTAVHVTSLNNMRIDGQTLAVAAHLDRASIPWALFKGQARRAAESRYPFASARGVTDVDLLVPEALADEAWALLCDRGFRRLITEPVPWTADHHRPALIDDANVCVELHTTTCMSVPADEAWRRATAHADIVEWNGAPTRVPNATELVWQALSHAVADGVRGFSLRGFLNIAAILAESPLLDWPLIATRIDADEIVGNDTSRPVARERVRESLAIAARLAGTSLDAAVQPKREVDLVPLLQWRGWALSLRLGRATRERLLEEALRHEAGLPLTPNSVYAVHRLHHVRRRSSSVVARVAYVSWRALQ